MSEPVVLVTGAGGFIGTWVLRELQRSGLQAVALVRGEPYTIGYTGIVGYDYVEDVASAFVRGVLECPPGATIVDLPSQPATPHEFVRLIESHHPPATGKITVAGTKIPANIPPCPRPIANVLPNWQVTPIEDGIVRTLQYYYRLS